MSFSDVVAPARPTTKIVDDSHPFANLWQMRVPRASKSFVLLNEDLYLTYLRESDDALGNVVTKRTLWRLHAARVAASG